MLEQPPRPFFQLGEALPSSLIAVESELLRNYLWCHNKVIDRLIGGRPRRARGGGTSRGLTHFHLPITHLVPSASRYAADFPRSRRRVHNRLV